MAKTKADVASDIALVESKLVRVQDIQPFLNICVYGRNKTGKTRFACSSDLDTLLIDCNERGTDSVRRNTNVTVYPMTKYDDLDPIYWYLKAGKHNHKVVVIDTVSMLATLGMKWVLKDDVERDLDRDPLTPDRRSWGKLGEALKETFLRFRNLDMHTVFLAQEKSTTSDDDESGGTLIEVHPELSPSPRSTLLSSVSVIGRLYVKEVEKNEKTVMQRRMLLGAHPKYVAGNRFEELKFVEINPTLGDFINRIYGDTTNASASKPTE